MPQITTTITHGVGLHARPAALFVRTAKQFTSTIAVHSGTRTANAKSMVQILTLAAKQGSELRIEATGDDADQALQALKELVEANFHEGGS